MILFMFLAVEKRNLRLTSRFDSGDGSGRRKFFHPKCFAMNLQIHTVHFVADAKLIEYVSRKAAKLNTFHDALIKVEVFLKLDNVVHHIKDKVVEIKVHVPRHDFFAKSSTKQFEESFDKAMDSMINQLKRRKEKQAA